MEKWRLEHPHDTPPQPLTPSPTSAHTSGGRRRASSLRPVALFDRDLDRAIGTAFDRDTGEPVTPDHLQSYRSNLAQYHLKPEAKFENGDYRDRGTTRRRHVCVRRVEWTGKEANRWEEQMFVLSDTETQLSYGSAPTDETAVLCRITKAAQEQGQRALARRSGVSRVQLAAILQGRANPRPNTTARLLAAIEPDQS